MWGSLGEGGGMDGGSLVGGGGGGGEDGWCCWVGAVDCAGMSEGVMRKSRGPRRGMVFGMVEAENFVRAVRLHPGNRCIARS